MAAGTTEGYKFTEDKNKMKQLNQEMVIILPKGMENIPVRVIYDDNTTELTVKLVSQPAKERTCMESENLHTAIYHQNRYEHVPMNEIEWIEANGSYCHVHTVKNRKITLSYPLRLVQNVLPEHTFIRIHRSYLINIDHIKFIDGNCVMMGGRFLKIGKEYQKRLLDRFVFLGVRHKPKCETK